MVEAVGAAASVAGSGGDCTDPSESADATAIAVTILIMVFFRSRCGCDHNQ